MDENVVTAKGLSIITIRPFSRKHKMPENLLRSMVKRGTLPGFFQGSRFYINEVQALEVLAAMCKQKEAHS